MMKLIVIDPGHGGRDPGAVANNLKEKDMTMQLALLITEQLAKYNTRVILTRETDTTLGLTERAEIANCCGADFFLSLHVNAGGGAGFESYIHTKDAPYSDAAKIQPVLHAQILAELAGYEIRNRGIKRANFYVLRETNMPAMLLENLFIDNKREAALWRTDHFPSSLAEGTVAGLEKALGIEKMQPLLYTVQIGAFRKRENARQQLHRARMLGFDDAFINIKDTAQ